MEFSIVYSNENTMIVEWQFKNFNYLLESAQKITHIINSEVFNVGIYHISRWYLQMRIFDERSLFGEYIGLFLIPKTFSGLDTAVFPTTQEYYIMDCDNEPILLRRIEHEYVNALDYSGTSRLLVKSVLLTREKEFLPQRTLKIACKLQLHIHSETSVKDSSAPFERRLYKSNHWDFIKSDIPIDVKFICDDGEIAAHKSVLSEHSRIFTRLFGPGPDGKCRSILRIPNVSLEVFALVLRFLYCGTVHNAEKYVYQLLETAHEYQIAGLTLECSKVICDEMSVENVVRILMIAHHHDNEFLMHSACQFIIEHITDVRETLEYKRMTNEKPQILAKLGEVLVTLQGDKLSIGQNDIPNVLISQILTFQTPVINEQ